jgi:hypothetical protein
MAKVFGLHPLRLRPGVDEEEFERFMAEALPKLQNLEGWKPVLLKGDRGDRAGKYLWMWELESLEALYRFCPTPDEPSAELEQYMEAHSEEVEEFMAKYATFTPCIPGENTVYTDYVVIAG